MNIAAAVVSRGGEDSLTRSQERGAFEDGLALYRKLRDDEDPYMGGKVGKVRTLLTIVCRCANYI